MSLQYAIANAADELRRWKGLDIDQKDIERAVKAGDLQTVNDHGKVLVDEDELVTFARHVYAKAKAMADEKFKRRKREEDRVVRSVERRRDAEARFRKMRAVIVGENDAKIDEEARRRIAEEDAAAKTEARPQPKAKKK